MRKLEALRRAYYGLKQVLHDARAVHDENERSAAEAQRLKRMYGALPADRKHEHVWKHEHVY